MRRKVTLAKGLRKSLSLLLIVMFFIFSFSSIATPATINKYEDTIEVVVNKNDSLWKIASKYNKKMDVRKLIYQIKEFNEINDTIYPGQVLYIPR